MEVSCPWLGYPALQTLIGIRGEIRRRDTEGTENTENDRALTRKNSRAIAGNPSNRWAKSYPTRYRFPLARLCVAQSIWQLAAEESHPPAPRRTWSASISSSS
jgi:hypothetical protein